MNSSAKDKLIVALDVESAQRAHHLFRALRETVGMFKIGSQLFTAAGPQMVREIVAQGGRVFLDLKFHDIPNTVAAAGVEAARLGVSIFNVHASGGSEMMRRTAEAVAKASERDGFVRPAVIAVTVLTSVDETVLSQVGVTQSPKQQVEVLAQLAESSGMDGVVASPKEIAVVRSSVGKEGFLIVSPGVRPAGSEAHDQKRVMTPAEAVRAGADYLIVGRPIIGAADPVLAASQVIKEMAETSQ